MNERYRKREDEPEYEYGLRLIGIKMEERPDDLDWEDIVELTRVDVHRETLRKAVSTTPYSGYNVMKYYEKKLQESGCGQECAGELDNTVLEIRKEWQKLSDQRREMRKLVTQAGRAEYLEEKLLEAAKSLGKTVPLSVDKAGSGYTENEAVLVLTDWHYGMTADNIWERYDTEECRRRVGRLVEQARERLLLHECRKLHVVILGDMAHGAIRTSARVASEELTCEQIMHVSELLAQTIAGLADCVEHTMVYATFGNHLRTVQNAKDSIHMDNMERLIPWWLQQRLSERRDTEIIQSEYYEFLYLNVCGKNICATHGDLDGVKTAGRLLNTLFSKKYGRGIDCVVLGDKHHQEEFEELGIDTMIAKSLCGTDEYANKKRLYSTPGQCLMIFNPENGRDATYQLKVVECAETQQ